MKNFMCSSIAPQIGASVAAGVLMLVGSAIVSKNEDTFFGHQVTRERPVEVVTTLPEFERRRATNPIWEEETRTRVRTAYLQAVEEAQRQNSTPQAAPVQQAALDLAPEPQPARPEPQTQPDRSAPRFDAPEPVRVADVVPVDRDSASAQPLERAAPEPIVSVAAEASDNPGLTPTQRPRLAIIIDDLGMDSAGSRDALALDPAVTLSILPYPENAPNLAQQAVARGFEVFLHLPMQPEGIENPGENAITVDLSDEEISRRVRWAFSRVPGAIGFNNHMGSLVTQSPEVLRPVFEPVAGQDLYFIDSLTSPDSVAYDVARGMGLNTLRRNVFLDHDPSPAAIEAQVREAIALAKRQGHAIAIGHPYPETLNALFDIRGMAAREGVDLVPISAMFNPPVADQGT